VIDAVRAAGGVVVRRRGGRVEVVLVHRPRYDDWTLPKGKCEPDEPDEDCAVREVEEETGLRCALGPELPSAEYLDPRGRPKRVRYWAMTAIAGRSRPSPPEVDEVRWASVRDAEELLTHPHDATVLRGL
jgi:8-oxo-dGTP diphosphatase